MTSSLPAPCRRRLSQKSAPHPLPRHRLSPSQRPSPAFSKAHPLRSASLLPSQWHPALLPHTHFHSVQSQQSHPGMQSAHRVRRKSRNPDAMARSEYSRHAVRTPRHKKSVRLRRCHSLFWVFCTLLHLFLHSLYHLPGHLPLSWMSSKAGYDSRPLKSS